MRRLLSALVGMAGLAAAGLILLMALNEKLLDAVVTFTVIGQIPGTNTQLTFMSSVVSGMTILATGLCGALVYRRLKSQELAAYMEVTDSGDAPNEAPEPFDGEDIIMVADKTHDNDYAGTNAFDKLLSGHQSLPVQLQLF